jgi:hypothetical protein
VTTIEDTKASRFDRLRTGVSRLGGRDRRAPVARWLMIGGGALMTLGVAVIILGWAGASHTPYVFEQLPYVISGGLLGTALAVIGGLLYFAYWMTRTLEESRAAANKTQETLLRIEELLGARALAQTNGSPAKAVAVAKTDTKPFVKTTRGSMYHRPDCTIVAGRSGLVDVSADGEGFEPCGVCDPVSLVR